MLNPVGTVAGCWLECAAGAGVSVTETPLPTTPRAAAAAAAADADGGTEPDGMDCGRNTGGCAGQRESRCYCDLHFAQWVELMGNEYCGFFYMASI